MLDGKHVKILNSVGSTFTTSNLMATIKRIALLIFLILLISSTTPSAFGDDNVDQKQEVDIWYAYCGWPHDWQEFVPSKPLLIGVDVKIKNANKDYGVYVTVNIREGSIDNPVLRSKSRSVPKQFGPDWVHFKLDPMTVKVGEIYVIEFFTGAKNVRWHLAYHEVIDYYPLGESSISNSEIVDFCFRTYWSTPYEPVGGEILPVNLSSSLAPLICIAVAISIPIGVVFSRRLH